MINENPCKCGEFSHRKTNYGACILNKKNIHLLSPTQLEEIQLRFEKLTSDNKDRINLKKKNSNEINLQKYFEIGKSANFQISNVIGNYVQMNPNESDYGRHIMPARILRCHHCDALVWPEEKTYSFCFSLFLDYFLIIVILFFKRRH